jgi:hypothetical protein
MEEIEQWFEDTLGHLGFSLTPTMYNPDTFAPIRGILYTYPIDNQGHRRSVKLRTSVTPLLYHHHRQLLVEELVREIERSGLPMPNFGTPKPIDFSPIKEITRFKFT